MSKDSSRLDSLRKRVAQAPSGPGIYKWLDDDGRVLYVGKAKNLRKRLASYVAPIKKSDGPWKQSFKEQITDLDVTVTTTELEALLLETNLIKQLRPKYNVLMKDDKSYLFIRISLKDAYPRVETIRRYVQDDAKYFGPFLHSEHVYRTLDMLHLALKYRACRESIDTLNKKGANAVLRECLECQIGRCNGLCAGLITQEEYRSRINHVIDFLKGNTGGVRAILEQKMQSAAANKKFEAAATIRNYLGFLDRKPEKQIATDTTGEDSDILGVAVLSGRAHVVIMHRRNGRLIGESHFALAGQAESVASVLAQFIPQFYEEGQEVPPMVLLPEAPPEPGALQDLLKERRQGAVKLIMPERGRKSRLVQLAEKNAREKARQMESKWEAEEKNSKSALENLQEILKLPTLPKRIEGYDISHLGGTETVGSMVVMKDAKTANDQYRSFTIRSLKSGDVDDYKAIREVLTRRIRRLTEDLPAEEKKLAEEGIKLRKARKADQEAIEKIRSESLELTTEPNAYGEFLIAEDDGTIVACARLREDKKMPEIQSVWVAPEYQGGRLGQLLIRKILRTVKKGKVYLIAVAELENYYAQIGFRYVMQPPPVFEQKMADFREKHPDVTDLLVMMWEAHQNKIDPSLTAKPDLIVIDGGKGQLSSAIAVLQSFKSDIPAIGLAKREEEIFLPNESYPFPPGPRSPEGVVGFPQDSAAKFLLMRLRDEAHRFSNAHREKRAKNTMTKSSLDDIPGIAEPTMKKLIAKFGSPSGIKEATDDELLEILSNSQLSNLRGHF